MPNEPVLRDETIPRVSALTHFLDEEEFDAIPKDILHNKACEGTEKHNTLEVTYNKQTDNLLARMFAEGLTKIFTAEELKGTPIFEEQLNGSRFTGKPDFILLRSLLDYKFCLELRAATAIKIVLYGMLMHELRGVSVNRFFAFHFPHDRALFIHKIPDATVPVLVGFANYIIDNHDSIKEGGLEKFEALSRWKEIQRDHILFEYIGSALPPMMIVTEEDAVEAASTFIGMQAVTDHEKVLKRELKRYMEETGSKRIENVLGYGVRLQNNTIKTYDTVKAAAAKTIYDAAKKDSLTGTIAGTKLVRFRPPKKK